MAPAGLRWTCDGDGSPRTSRVPLQSGSRLPSPSHGPWRSLVARLTGGQEVVGSNPAGPTICEGINRSYWSLQRSRNAWTASWSSFHVSPGGSDVLTICALISAGDTSIKAAVISLHLSQKTSISACVAGEGSVESVVDALRGHPSPRVNSPWFTPRPG